MGYTTDFDGTLQLSRPATEVEKNYINTFSGTRRMKRDTNKLWELYKGEHGNPFESENTYGIEGEYFAMDDGQAGQSDDDSIIDYNTPPGQNDDGDDWRQKWATNEELIFNGKCQPSLWCQWVINDDGTELEWDGGEKFYHYVEWLKYLINHFFEKWGIKLNGEITWQGEEISDRGTIIVKDNQVFVK